jgi:murein L,D-transpeptidase YafK
MNISKNFLILIVFMSLFQGFALLEVHAETKIRPQPKVVTPDLLLYEGVKKDYIIMIEKSTQKLFIFDGGQNILKTFKITTGQNVGNKTTQGDKRTPEGIYFATDVLKALQLAPEYGIMAIPMNYPNPIDIAKKRGGKGIWIHATNHSDRLLKPYDTKGCVVTINGDILEIARYINLETTPVIISKKIVYTTPDKLKQEGDTVKTIIDDWKTAWEQKDIDNYISYYSEDFRSQDMNINQWKRYKDRLYHQYNTIKVNIEDLRLLHYDGYIVAVFKQEYSSDSLRDIGIKRLYLTKRDKDWRISAEEWAKLPEKSPTKIAEEYIASKHIKVPEKILPEKMIPEKIISAKMIPEKIISEKITPEKITPEKIATEKIATEDKIGIEDFSFSFKPPHEIRFKLINKTEAKLIGRIAVVAYGQDAQYIYGSYPQNLELKDDGTLTNFNDGEWYSIKKFKVVTGQIEGLEQKNKSIETIKVLVYSYKGELMLTKELSNKAAIK